MLRRMPAALAIEQSAQDAAHLASGLVASGLVNDALDAPIETAAVLRRQVLAGNHYDRNVVPLRPTAHFVDELEAIHFGHDEIENNRVRAGLLEARQRDPAVLRLGEIPSVVLEVEAHLTSDDIVVIDQKNAPADRTTYSPQCLGQLLTVYGLDQIFAAAERISAIFLVDNCPEDDGDPPHPPAPLHRGNPPPPIQTRHHPRNRAP